MGTVAVMGMLRKELVAFLFLALVASSWQEETSNLKKDGRDKKIFSLFNVVTFKNDGCTSSNAGRNGTCFTSTECNDKGGTASGNCAAGFGVCCVFILTTTGDITQNCSYIQNPSYPSSYSDTTSLTYTVRKCSDDVCFIRLDFDSFTIQGPAATNEPDNGHNCVDSFIVTGTSGLSSPVICGINTGQHVYMDMGQDASNTATVRFTFSGAATTRQWDIKVTQIPCYGRSKPPSGCLQYLTDLSGRIKTFNFDDATNQQHLATQDYNICIRPEAGYCCVEYSLCSDANSWTLSTNANIDNTADLDTQCEGDDHLKIQGLSGNCDAGDFNAVLHSKICGTKFSSSTTMALAATDPNQRVCDCVQPFQVGVFTDALRETEALNRGACLEYRQLPCTNNN